MPSVPSIDLNTELKGPNAPNAELLEMIKTQESSFRFKSFNSETAFEVGTTLRNLVKEKHPEIEKEGKSGLVIRIALWNDHILFQSAVGEGPDVGPSNGQWIQAKFNTVKQFSRSSLSLGRLLALKDIKPEDLGLKFPDFAWHGGGFPIWIDIVNQYFKTILGANEKGVTVSPIGAIVVSGLPQLEDHQLVVEALSSLPHLFA